MRLYRRMHRRLPLGSFLLRVLLRKVTSHEATAYRADDRVMSRVVTGDTADDRALEATGSVRGSDRGERQHGTQQD